MKYLILMHNSLPLKMKFISEKSNNLDKNSKFKRIRPQNYRSQIILIKAHKIVLQNQCFLPNIATYLKKFQSFYYPFISGYQKNYPDSDSGNYPDN